MFKDADVLGSDDWSQLGSNAAAAVKDEQTGQARIIANYLTVARWGWTNSLHVLIVPYMTSAMGIFLLRQNYMSFPGELKELALHRILQAVYTGNTVRHLNDSTHFRDFQFIGVSLDLILDHRTDFFWS